MTRPTISDLLCLVAVILRGLTGCAAGAPDPLRAAIGANNAAVVVLDALREAHEKRVVATFHEHVSTCPPEPYDERQQCVSRAAALALVEHASERVRIAGLVLTEQLAADALEAARGCRERQDTCEAARLQAAERALYDLRAGLARAGAP